MHRAIRHLLERPAGDAWLFARGNRQYSDRLSDPGMKAGKRASDVSSAHLSGGVPSA